MVLIWLLSLAPTLSHMAHVAKDDVDFVEVFAGDRALSKAFARARGSFTQSIQTTPPVHLLTCAGHAAAARC